MRLTAATIEPRQFAADDNLRIERIGDDIAVFFGRHRLPIAKRNLACVAATSNSDRAAFLLPAVKPIRKSIVRAYVIELRGGLVIPRAPRFATVHGDDRALIRAEQNDLRIVRINPNVLIIVAAGSAAPTFPCLAAVD